MEWRLTGKAIREGPRRPHASQGHSKRASARRRAHAHIFIRRCGFTKIVTTKFAPASMLCEAAALAGLGDPCGTKSAPRGTSRLDCGGRSPGGTACERSSKLSRAVPDETDK